MSSSPTDGQLQARIAHLNIIQGVIGRVAGYSAAVKNFNLTIAAALIALAFDKSMPTLLLAGLGITAMFALLDSYYLALEKCFRDLYGDVTKRDWVEALNLSINHRSAGPLDVMKAVASVSVWGFYGPLLVGLALLSYLPSHVQPAELKTNVSRSAGGHAGERSPVAASGPRADDPNQAERATSGRLGASAGPTSEDVG